MKNDNEQHSKKSNIVFKIIKLIFKTLAVFFPFMKIIKTNSLLKKAAKVHGTDGKKHPYFFRQRLLNWFLVLLTISPLILGVSYSYNTLTTNKGIDAAYKLSIKEYKKNKSIIIIPSLIKAKRKFDKVLAHPKVSKYQPEEAFSSAQWAIVMGILISFIVGMVVVKFHPLLYETQKLKRLLINNGLSNKEQKDPIVLATPLGFLIDITGHRPREVRENESIWMALNVKVDSHVQDADRLALVFFLRSFQLKKSYMYEFDKKEIAKK